MGKNKQRKTKKLHFVMRKEEATRGNTRLARTREEGRRKEDWSEVFSPFRHSLRRGLLKEGREESRMGEVKERDK